MALQHLRSSTANKRPLPAGMSDGQLAINTNNTSPGLFFKDSAGALVKVGPVHVGTTAPNASPASGGETGNTVGEQWLDTTGGTYVFKVWDGSAWRSESGTFVDVNGDTMTGALGIIAGTAAAPGLYFSGDTDTGIYSPAANELAISTNSTGRLFIDSSGKVGIGATPEATLHVAGSVSGAYIAQIIQNQNAGGYSQQIFRVGTGAGTKEAGISYAPGTFLAIGPTANDTTTPIVFQNNNAQERLRITAAGLVGIGTSSPSSVLHISSASPTVRISDTSGTASNLTGQILFQEMGTTSAMGRIGYTGGDAILRVKTDGAQPIAFLTNDAERVRITSGGNVGIGTTNPQAPLSFGATAGTAGTANKIRIYDSTPNIYGLGVSANQFDYISDGSHVFYTSNGGGSPAEKARLDTSGRLLVGTSSARSNFYNSSVTSRVQIAGTGAGGSASQASLSLVNESANSDEDSSLLILGRSFGGNTLVTNNARLGVISFQGADGSELVEGASVAAFVDGTSGANDLPCRLVFSVTQDGSASPTERQRINSAGATLFFSSADGIRSAVSASAGTSTAVFWGRHSATSTSNGTDSFFVWSNGNVVNTNNSYGAISDIKLKENIVDAGSQWNDLKALQVRKYNFKEGQTHTQIGLVAQEVELVSPGLVSESPDRDEDGNDLGTTTKSVNYSVLYMKAVKALQEAMERIETLEAKVAALESA